jgi:hypothetical protein
MVVSLKKKNKIRECCAFTLQNSKYIEYGNKSGSKHTQRGIDGELNALVCVCVCVCVSYNTNVYMFQSNNSQLTNDADNNTTT